MRETGRRACALPLQNRSRCGALPGNENFLDKSKLGYDSTLIKPTDNPPPSQSRLKTIVFGFLLPVAIGLLGLAVVMAMGKSKPKQIAIAGNDPESRLTRLSVVLAKPVESFDGIETLDIDVTGVVVPFRQVTLAAEISGRVAFKSDACRIGRFVDAGELLFRLDSTDYQLEVERLAAMRDSEYAQQRELDQEVANAQRSLELADQEVALQEKELQRLEKLPAGFATQRNSIKPDACN